VPAIWHIPADAVKARVLLYRHGAGFDSDYWLAPENPFPAAFEDALASYRLIDQGVSPQSLAVAGDSCGDRLDRRNSRGRPGCRLADCGITRRNGVSVKQSLKLRTAT
jgi:hypothetical protein